MAVRVVDFHHLADGLPARSKVVGNKNAMAMVSTGARTPPRDYKQDKKKKKTAEAVFLVQYT